MTDIEKYIIGALITNPKNDKDVGFNSALITLLKGMAAGIPLDLTEANNANNTEPEVDAGLDAVLSLRITKRSALRKEITKVNTDFGYSVDNKELDRIITEFDAGSKLAAVKILKEISRFGLKEAADCVSILQTIH
jgi:hypothetical protein